MAAYLLSIFADIIICMPGHNGEELQEAVEGVAVAGRQKVDEELQGTQLFFWFQHYTRQRDILSKTRGADTIWTLRLGFIYATKRTKLPRPGLLCNLTHFPTTLAAQLQKSMKGIENSWTAREIMRKITPSLLFPSASFLLLITQTDLMGFSTH